MLPTKSIYIHFLSDIKHKTLQGFMHGRFFLDLTPKCIYDILVALEIQRVFFATPSQLLENLSEVVELVSIQLVSRQNNQLIQHYK